MRGEGTPRSREPQPKEVKVNLEARISEAVDAVANVYSESPADFLALYEAAAVEQAKYGVGSEENNDARQDWNDAHADLSEKIGAALAPFGIDAGNCVDYGVYSINGEDIYIESELGGVRADYEEQISGLIQAALETQEG